MFPSGPREHLPWDPFLQASAPSSAFRFKKAFSLPLKRATRLSGLVVSKSRPFPSFPSFLSQRVTRPLGLLAPKPFSGPQSSAPLAPGFVSPLPFKPPHLSPPPYRCPRCMSQPLSYCPRSVPSGHVGQPSLQLLYSLVATSAPPLLLLFCVFTLCVCLLWQPSMLPARVVTYPFLDPAGKSLDSSLLSATPPFPCPTIHRVRVRGPSYHPSLAIPRGRE